MNRFQEVLNKPMAVGCLDEHLNKKECETIGKALAACASGAFRIKPLVWEYKSIDYCWTADSILGIFIIRKYIREDSYYLHAPVTMYGNFTLDEAKAAAWNWYQKELRKALEEIV